MILLLLIIFSPTSDSFDSSSELFSTSIALVYSNLPDTNCFHLVHSVTLKIKLSAWLHFQETRVQLGCHSCSMAHRLGLLTVTWPPEVRRNSGRCEWIHSHIQTLNSYSVFLGDVSVRLLCVVRLLEECNHSVEIYLQSSSHYVQDYRLPYFWAHLTTTHVETALVFLNPPTLWPAFVCHLRYLCSTVLYQAGLFTFVVLQHTHK